MSALVHDDLVVAVLGSGSKGNCTYIGTAERGVLVDCGLSTKQIYLRMSALGLADAQLDAVFVTHEHSDHVAAGRVLSARFQKQTGDELPFYGSQGTHRRIRRQCRPSLARFIAAGESVRMPSVTVSAFCVPHDTHEPLGFRVSSAHGCAVVITDLGRSTKLVQAQLHQATIAVVEFNHDLEMLLDGPYPWQLKQRVRGQHGHLSNSQAGELVRLGASQRLKHLICGHRSQDNNTEELVEKAAGEALFDAGLKHTSLHIAQQAVPGPVLSHRALPKEVRSPQLASTQLSLFA